MTTKPQRMEIHTENIPDEIKQQAKWVMWRWEFRKGKWTKPPYQVNGELATSTDPATWTDFESALKAFQNGGKWDGIGFTLSKDDPYVGIDWDNCISPSGEINPKVLALVRDIDSYTEVSPSGTGLKTLLRGELPAGGHHNKFDDIEVGVFDCSRYFCITGRTL